MRTKSTDRIPTDCQHWGLVGGLLSWSQILHVFKRSYVLSMNVYEPGSLRLSNQINAEHHFGFICKLFVRATKMGRLLGPMEGSIKLHFQEHNYSLPVRESDWDLAIFQSLA